MLVIIAAAATLAILVGGTQLEDQPVDDNPDCNVQNNTEYVYNNCTLRCQGDELIPLSGKQKCILQIESMESSYLERGISGSYGNCVEGECINTNNTSEDLPAIP
uniref:Putative secreted protein n=1 Tax=Amblyomma cajennense TaxID=34607 RepID=A0A023FF93_AMBCJ